MQSAESRAKTFEFLRFSLAFGVVLGSNLLHDRVIDDLRENFRGSLCFGVLMSVMSRAPYAVPSVPRLLRKLSNDLEANMIYHLSEVYSPIQQQCYSQKRLTCSSQISFLLS